MKVSHCLPALFAALLFCSCTSKHKIAFEGMPVNSAELSELKSKYCLSRVHSLREVVRVSAKVDGGERQAFRYIILLKEPNLIRIDVLPIDAGFVLGKFVADEKDALFLDYSERIVTRGHSIQALLRRKLSLPLTFEDLRTLLSGQLSVLACEKLSQAQRSGDGVIHLMIGSSYFRFSKDTLGLDYLEFLSPFSGKRELQASYLEQQSSYPKSIALGLDEYNIKADLLIKSMEINPKLESKLFSTEVPPDFRESASSSDL